MKIIKINNKTIEELEKEIPAGQNIPHHVDRWYNRHEKSWVVQLKDKYTNQIGDAIYVYSKQEAIKVENRFKEEYDLHYSFEQHKTIEEIKSLKSQKHDVCIQDRNVIAEMEFRNLAIDLNVDFTEDGKHIDYWVAIKDNNGDWEGLGYLMETPTLDENLEEHMFNTLIKFAKENGYI